MSRTHLPDSSGRNITSGHRYKIRLVGGGGAELLLSDTTRTFGKPQLVAGQPGSGSVFYIDDSDWPDKTQVQLRVDANVVAYPSAPLLGSYITYVKQGERYEKVHGDSKPAGDGGVFGIRGERNTVFLARSGSRGLRVNYASLATIETDTVNGMLEVEFVRLPELEAET